MEYEERLPCAMDSHVLCVASFCFAATAEEKILPHADTAHNKRRKNRRREQQKNAKPTRRSFHFISKVSSCTDCRGLKKNKRVKKKKENKQRRRTSHQFKTGISTRESRFSGFWLLARPIPAVRHLVQPLLAGSIVAMPRNIVGHTRRDWSHGLALLFLPVSSFLLGFLGPFFAHIECVFFLWRGVADGSGKERTDTSHQNSRVNPGRPLLQQ